MDWKKLRCVNFNVMHCEALLAYPSKHLKTK